MANNRITGTLGLSMAVINPSSAPKFKMNAAEVIEWRAALPMADTGAAAKSLYMAFSNLSKTYLEPTKRFEILELLRSTNKTICTTLKKHYVEQNVPLTEHKLTIANLRQTLISEMAENYKIILEELHNKPNKTAEERNILIITVSRILYYFNAVLLCRYQLYSYVPENIWHEIYLLYQYAKRNDILNIQVSCPLSFNATTSVIGSFTRIILLAATDPYQWRQKDQYSINKAIDLWAVFPTIFERAEIPATKRNGVYIIDLASDFAPVAYNFRHEPLTDTCIALDLAKNVKHLKHLLLKMHNSELKTKIDNPGDPEFTVNVPILIKLIKIWSQRISRNTQRFPMTAQIKIVFGLAAAYYFINNQKEFDPRPSHLDAPARKQGGAYIRSTADLPTYEIEEEEEEEESLTSGQPSKPTITNMPMPKIEIEHPYHIYNYNIENISHNGFCIIINDNTFPPFQNSEIVAFKKNVEEEGLQWSVGTVRWIKSPAPGIFQIGIELVAAYAKTAGIQMLRDNQPAGVLLRCLILPEAIDETATDEHAAPVLITPMLPISSSKIVLYLDQEKGLRTTLVKELESTSTYHKYTYSTKDSINIAEPKTPEEIAQAKLSGQPEDEAVPSEEDEDSTKTEFDSIWEDL